MQPLTLFNTKRFLISLESEFNSLKIWHFLAIRKKSGPLSVTENGPKAKKAYPKTSLDF